METLKLGDGRTLAVHDHGDCDGRYCCIHNPSDHRLNKAPFLWRDDRLVPFLERVCDHGIGHPDPDSLDHLESVLPSNIFTGQALGVHGCDGCCFVDHD